MLIYGLISAEPEHSQLILKINLITNWTDSRLTWNPEDFGGLESLSMSKNTGDSMRCVWSPDLEILSNAGVETELNNPKVLVFWNGTVHMYRVGRV